jgi:hypothetical protein
MATLTPFTKSLIRTRISTLEHSLSVLGQQIDKNLNYEILNAMRLDINREARTLSETVKHCVAELPHSDQSKQVD